MNFSQRSICVFTLSLIVISGSTLLTFARTPELSATDVLKTMAATYAALTAYQDVGVVERVRSEPLATRSTQIYFKTSFSRPRKLRFEWTDFSFVSASGRNILWSDGEKTRSFYSYDSAVRTNESVGRGIASATGVSRSSAHTITRLLALETAGFSILDLKGTELRDQQEFEGEECYVLEGFHPNGDRWQLWVAKKDYLLRKLRQPVRDGFDEEIHREIRINGSIPDEVYHPKISTDGRLTLEIEKDKDRDIRRVLAMVLPKERINQTLSEVLEALRQITRPQVPDKVWQDVIEELHIDSELILQSYVRIYDFYYTHDEVRQLLKFYESPLGRKLVRNAVLIELESSAHGQRIGRELIQRVTEKLRAKGYSTA